MGFARHKKVSDLNSFHGIVKVLFKYCKIIRIDSMIYMYIHLDFWTFGHV